MNAFYRLFLVVMLSLVWTLTGCGRNIPVIEPALLEQKSSILLVTGPELTDNVKGTLQATLAEWHNQKHLSYEWLQNSDPGAVWTPDLLAKIRSIPYDYIVVAGHSLVQSAIAPASEVPERRWLLLDDAITREAVQVNGSHITLKSVPGSQFRELWNDWVKEQRSSDRAVEWVTTSAYPIPPEWVSSQESELITLADAQGWFAPFQSKVRRHGPSWIGVYAPLEASQMERLRGLQIPVMNLAGTTVELQWNGILTSMKTMMEEKSWTPGLQPYKPSEAKITQFPS